MIRRQSGLNKFEFSVSIAVIGLLAVIAFQRYFELQELGEKAQVEATIRNIQSGLAQEMARRIIAGQDGQVEDMVGSNPVRWLAQPPERYLGEFAASVDIPESEGWSFDRERKELQYRPTSFRNLVIVGDKCCLRWQVRRPRMGEPRPFLSPVGVTPVTAYQWF
jgi:hypothetical protein